MLKHYPRWLPDSHSKTLADPIRKLHQLMVDPSYNMVKSQVASSVHPPSFTADVLDGYAWDGSLISEDDEFIRGSAATFLGAGTHTTVRTTFMLVMVHHPEVFKKAQAG